MPFGDRHFQRKTEVVEPQELIVDERLERADIHGVKAFGTVIRDLGQNGKEGSFGLAGGRRRRDHHVIVMIKDGLDRPLAPREARTSLSGKSNAGFLDGAGRKPLRASQIRKLVSCPSSS